MDFKIYFLGFSQPMSLIPILQGTVICYMSRHNRKQAVKSGAKRKTAAKLKYHRVESAGPTVTFCQHTFR
jgi:hypothetical protein